MVTAQAFDSREWTVRAGADHGPLTARMVLFGSDPHDVVPKGGWPQLREILSHVSPRLRPLVERELAAALAGLFETDVGQVLSAAWRGHGKLVEAAQASLEHPGVTEMVALATHQIVSSHQPHVDLVVDGAKVATVEVTIEITVDVEGLLASVRDGRLIAVHSGRCLIQARLEFAGSDLASGEATFEAPGVVDLGAGVDLLFWQDQPGTEGPPEMFPSRPRYRPYRPGRESPPHPAAGPA